MGMLVETAETARRAVQLLPLAVWVVAMVPPPVPLLLPTVLVVDSVLVTVLLTVPLLLPTVLVVGWVLVTVLRPVLLLLPTVLVVDWVLATVLPPVPLLLRTATVVAWVVATLPLPVLLLLRTAVLPQVLLVPHLRRIMALRPPVVPLQPLVARNRAAIYSGVGS
jgi:hypothetical protein